MSFLLLPIIGYIIRYERQNLVVYATGAVATALPFLIYNLSIFGNVFGGYKQNLALFTFGIDSIGNFAGLLFAPNVGLLVFSPVLILSVFGYLKLNTLASERIRQVLVLFGPAILLQILVYSFFGQWDSSVAYSYGQRFLTGFVPILAIYIGIVLHEYWGAAPEIPQTKVIRTAIILLIVLSVIIQATGVFLYPLLPDRSTSAERTWDWDHSIISESYGNGISKHRFHHHLLVSSPAAPASPAAGANREQHPRRPVSVALSGEPGNFRADPLERNTGIAEWYRQEHLYTFAPGKKTVVPGGDRSSSHDP